MSRYNQTLNDNGTYLVKCERNAQNQAVPTVIEQDIQINVEVDNIVISSGATVSGDLLTLNTGA